MQIIALLPGLIAAYVAWMKSARHAFFDVYLPVLILLPDYYRWIAPGLPDPTFSMAAILPVAVVYFIKKPAGSPSWRFSFADFLVGGYAFSVALSEYLNAGYNDAQNLMFEMICWAVLPYALAKGMVEPEGLRIPFAKRIVWLFFLLSVGSVYEFKMGATPYRMILDRFFPGQADGWVTTFRWGFARIAGPYGHAILAGVILIAAYRIQRWLEWSGHWEPVFRKFHPVKQLTKARILTIGLFAGVVMTMVRGPWIGGFLAAVVIAIGKQKNRWMAVGVILAALVVVGTPVGVMFYQYVSVGRAGAKTVAQESAAYRKELIDKYVAIVVQKSVFGWGRNYWPKVDGMNSIDNYYLLLALMHGLLALGFLVAIFVSFMWRLFWRGMNEPLSDPPGSSLSFTLLGIYWSILFSIATVFMGNQLIPVFFLITGWAEGYLIWGKDAVAASPQTAAERPNSPYNFRRVLS
jgi:hypothetical protein